MNEKHEPRHAEPRRPLRLQPLPRPSRRAAPATEQAPESEPPAAESGWIHEWSQPQPLSSTDA